MIRSPRRPARHPIRAALLTLALAAAAAVPAPARSQPVLLPDSTAFETFRLSNGLRVVLRHVPRGDRVVAVVAYGSGSAADPQGREGLHALLAEIAYFGPADGAPARDRAAMPGLRPAGWDVLVGTRATYFAEAATLAQLPGVLRQVAARMRGVEPDAATLRAALETVTGELRARWSGASGAGLGGFARAAAEHRDPASIEREATGAGLARLGPRDVAALLRERFVPANAVLSLAGNLATLPMRDLLEAEFGSIPAGRTAAAPAPAPLDSAVRAFERPGLDAPRAVLGVLAPSLADSTHPSFFLASLLVGNHLTRWWPPPPAGAGGRFRFVLHLDERLVRLLPPLGPDDPLGIRMYQDYVLLVRQGAMAVLEPASVEALWRGVDWLLGGPIPPERIGATRNDTAALATIAVGQAFRELSGGEAFWSVYRERFRRAATGDPSAHLPEMILPERVARVVLHPAP